MPPFTIQLTGKEGRLHCDSRDLSDNGIVFIDVGEAELNTTLVFYLDSALLVQNSEGKG
jgi:hypothetical protein